jgi:hypothetical protein
MFDVLAKRTKLSLPQLRHLAATGFELGDRRAGHALNDATVQKYFPKTLPTCKSLFDGATAVRYLANGKGGITFIVQYEGLAAPVVLKVMASQKGTGCRLSNLVCVFDGDWKWHGYLDARRELRVAQLISDVEHTVMSPHFLHTYLARPLAIRQKCTMRKLGQLHGAPKHKLEKLQGGAQTLVANVLEFGGMPSEGIIKGVIASLPTARAIACLRGLLTQVLQALVILANEDVVHGDCHDDNILGTATVADYLYYEAVVRDARGNVTPYYIKMPTNGILWRIMDFGRCTSSQLFGGKDHGLAARTFFGGPMWKKAVMEPALKALPLEAYDFARAMDAELDNVSKYCSKPVAAAFREDVLALARTGVEFAKTVPGSVSIQDATRFNVLPKKVAIATDRTIAKDIATLEEAMRNHGCMLHVFLAAAKRFKFMDIDDDTFHDTNVFMFEAGVRGHDT